MESFMKKVAVNGVRVKQLRLQLERLATQKEMAYEIGVGVRTLRNVENKNACLSLPSFNRLAKALGVNSDEIALSPGSLNPVEKTVVSSNPVGCAFGQELFIPRFEEEYAEATSDENCLFPAAANSHDVAGSIKVSLNEEVGRYAHELIEILGGLSRSKQSILESLPPSQEIALRHRIRQLLVLLKGNDVWVYQISIVRRLPERETLPQKGEAHWYENRLMVVFGPPGEFGETKIVVPVDNGQPWLIPAGVPNFRSSPEPCSPK
jgi:DNA-binding XRE family transcriptional regulator